MAFREFLQSLFERVGLAEQPAPPPQAVAVPLADPERLQPIFSRIAAWGTKHVHLLVGDGVEPEDLVEILGQARQYSLQVSIRGRASDLPCGQDLADLATGVREVEIPFLSAIGEIHDALAGAGDYRNALRMMEVLANLNLPFAAQIVLVPSTWKTIERTLQLLDDRQVREVRIFAIACRDDQPSNWAISASELVAAAQSIEQLASGKMSISWYPPLRFDPSHTLAQQVRRGPRTAANAVRIEPDGRVIPPVGPPVSAGNILHDDWKSIARHETFRALKRERETAIRCDECPGLAACADGCLRDKANWSEG